MQKINDTNDSYVQNESKHYNKNNASNGDGNNNANDDIAHCLIGRSNSRNKNCCTQGELTVQGFGCYVQGFDCQITFYDNGG